MSQRPQQQNSLMLVQRDVRAILEQRKQQLVSIMESSPRAERLIVSGLIAVAEMKDRAGNQIAGDCDPVSIARAITQAALLGIDLTGGLGEGWLIKYGDQCTLSPGYRSWQRAAQSAGFDVVFDVVRAADHFEFAKYPPHLVHRPAIDKDRGAVFGAYAVASREGKIYAVDWCDMGELEMAHKSSKAPDSPAWKNWEDRMQRKLPLTRLVKDLPIDWTGRNAKLREVETIAERGGGYDVDFDDPTAVITGGNVPSAVPSPETATQPKTQAMLEARKQRAEPAHDQQTGEVAQPATQQAPAKSPTKQSEIGF